MRMCGLFRPSFLTCPASDSSCTWSSFLVVEKAPSLPSHGSPYFSPLPDFFSLSLLSVGQNLPCPTQPQGPTRGRGCFSETCIKELIRAVQKGSCCLLDSDSSWVRQILGLGSMLVQVRESRLHRAQMPLLAILILLPEPWTLSPESTIS